MAGPSRHIEWLYRQLPEWQERGWLAAEGAEALRAHYGPVSNNDFRRLTMLLIALMAALLIGGGLVLIFAYNWYALSRPQRAVVAVAPLLVTVVLGLIALPRQGNRLILRECAAVGNLFSLGAAIALVSQTYNVSGSLPDYLLAVCLLGLPVIYLLRSDAAALLYIVGIVWRRWEAAGWAAGSTLAYPVFWLTLALMLPFVLMRMRRWRTGGQGLFTLMLAAAALALPPDNVGFWGTVCAYALFLSLVVGLRGSDFGGRLVAGLARWLSLGSMAVLLVALSFRELWQETEIVSAEGAAALLVLLLVLLVGDLLLMVLAARRRDWLCLMWTGLGPLVVALRFATYHDTTGLAGALAIDALGLAVGALTLRLAYAKHHLGAVNLGLSLIAGIVVMRFFDSGLPMLWRGVGFIAVGALFVFVNLRLARQMQKEGTP